MEALTIILFGILFGAALLGMLVADGKTAVVMMSIAVATFIATTVILSVLR
jgi:ABC-type microcin C transport system permease subunit YejE